MTLTSLQERWPAQLDSDLLAKELYDDIEDAVEHLPGFGFRQGIDLNAWEHSESYWRLYADELLLETGKSSPILHRCRGDIVRRRLSSDASIRRAIADCLEQSATADHDEIHDA